MRLCPKRVEVEFVIQQSLETAPSTRGFFSRCSLYRGIGGAYGLGRFLCRSTSFFQRGMSLIMLTLNKNLK